MLACRHSKDLSLKCLRARAKNMRMITPRKVFFFVPNELTNKGHACMRESWETFHWSFTNLELLFVISVHFSLGFLKTGLAKISTHSVTWDRALFSFHFENYIPAGKEKRKESLIQNVYETSSAHFLIDWHLPNQTTKITSVTCFFSMQIFHTREKCRLTALKNSFYLLIFSRKNKKVSTITFNFLRD